jgi:hypothetical protein
MPPARKRIRRLVVPSHPRKRWSLKPIPRTRYEELREFFDLQEEKAAYKPTARVDAVDRYGQEFVNRFQPTLIGNREKIQTKIDPALWDAHVGVSLYSGKVSCAHANLGFTADSVIVESIQGEETRTMYSINRALGTPWPNFLLREVERNARAVGKKFVRIRRPETLHYYNEPAFSDTPREDPQIKGAINSKWLVKREKLQERMRKLYYSAAHKSGYRKMGSEFLVKKV